MLLEVLMFRCQLGLTGRKKRCKESIGERRRRALKEPETANTDTAHLMSGGQCEEPMNQVLK